MTDAAPDSIRAKKHTITDSLNNPIQISGLPQNLKAAALKALGESLYDRLAIGAPVQFRLFGDNRVFEGTITRLGGSGAASLYANLAVGVGAKHLPKMPLARVWCRRAGRGSGATG